MQQSAGNVGLLPRRDEHFGHTARRAPFAPTAAAPEGVTVCLSGAVLAPAPAAAVTGLVAKIEEAPVFVDDSGSRKRLLRVVGVLIGLLSIGFLSIVGVALAVPTVATSVGLGDVVPFVVPGAAAPPPPKAPEAPKVQAKPKPKPKPAVVKPEPKPVVEAPATKPAPVEQAPVTQAPVVEAPVVEAPVVERQALDVADLERDLEATLGRLSLRRLDERRGQVTAPDRRAGGRGEERELSGAAADVEPGVSLVGVGCGDDRLVHLGETRCDHLERACAPHRRVPLLQLLERHRRLRSTLV